MRILVFGAGVIGSVYAAKLIEAGNEVTFLARGRRLTDLQNQGLVVVDAHTENRTKLQMPALNELRPELTFDLVLVAIRAEQLASALPTLAAMTDNSDVLFFGNLAGHQAELIAALGSRVIYGFPAAGGVPDGQTIRYVLIDQQKTMLGEPDGSISPRLVRLQHVFDGAGFSTKISRNMNDWMSGHAAFVAPIAFALYRDGVDTARLAADGATLRTMVRATKQAFAGLRAAGNSEIATNLGILFRMPSPFVVNYWRKVLAGPHGELWFGAHSRSAPAEMRAVGDELQARLLKSGHPSADLDSLLAGVTT
jgi:2-dehydropantoate 2-reductase